MLLLGASAWLLYVRPAQRASALEELRVEDDLEGPTVEPVGVD